MFGPRAYDLNAGFVPVRKPGKLPAKSWSSPTSSNTSTDRLQVHEDAIEPGEKVLIVDDLVATGGTARAPPS